MRRLLLLCVLLTMLAVPALAFTTTFQNPDDYTNYFNCVISAGTGTCTYTQNTTGGNSYVTVTDGNGGTYTAIQNKDPLQTTYAAVTVISTSWIPTNGNINIGLKNSAGTSLYIYSGTTSSTYDRYEVVIVGGAAKFYKSGVLVGTSPALGTNPSYVAFGTRYSAGTFGPSAVFDDVVYGSTESPYIFSSPESGFYISKDMVNPANSGLTSPAGVIVSSNNMTATFGKSSSTTETLSLVNYGTGVSYCSYATPAGKSAGYVQWPLACLLNTDAPYGYYATTIAGSGEYSDLIAYIGDGASVTFDAASYSVDDTATVDYTISGGGYWDPVTYTYKMIIQDIFGNIVSTQSITSQTGSKTYTFDSGDTNGVYYAIVIATPIAGGDEIWMGYDSAELSSYITIEGYVNDAQTAIPINVSHVNITQGSLVNAMTTVDGNYSTTAGTAFLTGSEITINATATGYKQYLYSFTPATGSKKVINITMESLTPTFTGIALGGTCRDSVYGRPINYCAVTVTNATYGESYSVTANNAGYYLLDQSDGVYLTNGRWYSVAASKLGFSNSASYLKSVWGA